MESPTLRTIGNKIREQIETTHPMLLSEIDLTEGELKILRESADRLISRAIDGKDNFDIQTAYLMMDVGMRYYHEGTYWSDLWGEVSFEHTMADQTALGKFFVDTIKRYDLAVYEGSSRKYVNNILMHAFIPEKESYRDGFFNFVLKFYRIILKSSIPENMGEYLETIANVFKTGTLDKYPDFRNTPLIQSTKIALSDVKYFGHVVEKIIRRIDGNYETAENLNLGRYENSFRDWVNNVNTSKVRHRRINEKPYMQFVTDTSRFYMVVPSMELGREGCRLEIVSSSGEVLSSESLTVSNMFGKVISEEKTIPMKWNPLDEFKVVVDGKTRYINSNHGFILLNKKGNMRRRVALGFNMIVLPSGQEINLYSSTIGQWDEYSVCGFMINRDETLEVNGYRFTVEEEVSASVHVISPCLDVGCRDQDGNKFDLYAGHPTIRISVPEIKGRFRMTVSRGSDSISFLSLDQLRQDPAVHETGEDLILRIGDTDISSCKGIYKISLNNKAMYRYALLPGFQYRFNKDFYSDDEDSVMTYGDGSQIEFNTSQGTIYTNPIDIDGHQLTLRIQIPSRRFSFDKSVWHMFGEELYYRDTHYSSLYIYCPTLVYPILSVDYHGSRPIPLQIEGQYLTTPFNKISQISSIIESSGKNISSLKFSCGRFGLFTIRYNADYIFEEGTIVRRNAPSSTMAVCRRMSDGEEIPFIDDRLTMPDDMGDFEIIEYYDDGFGSESRTVLKGGGSITIPPDIANRIRAGDDISYIIDRKRTIQLPGSDFRNIISLDSPYNPEKQVSIRDAYENMGIIYISLYREAVSAVKMAILADKNYQRIRKRIERFRLYDVVFTYELCEAFLSLKQDSNISELKDELSPMYERLKKIR